MKKIGCIYIYIVCVYFRNFHYMKKLKIKNGGTVCIITYSQSQTKHGAQLRCNKTNRKLSLRE